MDLFRNASDDHIALAGCVAAFLLSGGLLYVSAYLRQSRQGDVSSRDQATGTQAETLAPAKSAAGSSAKKRKAA